MGQELILEHLIQDIEQRKKSTRWNGSFWDFEDVLKAEKNRAIRTSFQYLSDAIRFFGREEGIISGERTPIYNVWHDRMESLVPGRDRIFGMERTLSKLVSYIDTLAREEGKERIIILRGPPGTAKSGLINLMMKALELYSIEDEGKRYTFEWVFPKTASGSNYGYMLEPGSVVNVKSYAHLSDENIDAALECKLFDHPLLLLPKAQRIEYLARISEEVGEEIILPYKLEEKEMCRSCQSIVDSLFDKYKGDMSKVLRHVRVKTYTVSESSQRGVSTVISSRNPEGAAQLVISREPVAFIKLADKLKNVEYYNFKGEWASSSTGIIHFQDIFDTRSEQSLKALLSAIEEHKVDFNDVQAYIDTIIFGTTNLAQYEFFWQQDSNAGLKNRIRTIDIGYVLQPREEEKIYLKQLVDEAGFKPMRNRTSDRHIVPHTTYLAALWAVSTRLMQPHKFVSELDEELKTELMETLSSEEVAVLGELEPIEKARLFDGEIPDELSRDEKEILSRRHVQRYLRLEHEDLGEHSEGMYGVDPRTMQNILTDLCSETSAKRNGCIYPNEIFERIDWAIHREKYNEFVSLMDENIASFCEKGYGNPEKLLEEVRAYYDEIVENEVKWAIIGVRQEDIDNRIKDYLKEVMAYVNEELIQDPVTMQWKDPNESKMSEIEKYLMVGDDKDKFRQDLIRRIGSYAFKRQSQEGKMSRLEMTTGSIKQSGLDTEEIREIFPEIYFQIEESMYEEKKKSMRYSIEELSTFFEKYGTKTFDKLPQQAKDTVNRVMWQLQTHNYCDDCGKATVIYAIENRLIR